MYIRIYIHIYIHIYMYACTHIYIYTHIYVCIYMHIYMYVYIHINVKQPEYIYTNTYIIYLHFSSRLDLSGLDVRVVGLRELFCSVWMIA